MSADTQSLTEGPGEAVLFEPPKTPPKENGKAPPPVPRSPYAEIDSYSPTDESDEEESTPAEEGEETENLEDEGSDDAASAEDDNDLDDIARNLDFSPKQIKALKAAGMLKEALTDRAHARGLLNDDDSPSGEKPAAQKKTASTSEFPELPDLTPEQEEDMDPVLVKHLKAVKATVGLLKDQNERLQSQLRARETEAIKERLDASFGALSPEHKKLFGEGGLDELPRNSREFRNRAKVIEEMNTLHGVMSAKGQPINHNSLFQKALKLTFGDKVQTGTLRNLAQSRRAELFSAGRPENASRQRDASLADTEEQRSAKATRNLTKMMRSKGLI